MREINTRDATKGKAEVMGLSVVRSLRDDTRKCTYREIHCSKCGSTYQLQDQTFTRWAREKKMYCGYCNGSQKALPPELKCRQLNDKLVDTIYSEVIKITEYLGYSKGKEQAYCRVLFNKCGHTKEYSTTVLGHLVREGKAFKCDTCNSTGSEIERIVGDALPTHYTAQVPYTNIAECDRKWVSDFFSIRDNTLIEVSCGHTKERQDYSGNIADKESWCSDNGINFVFISSLNELHDIVQSLGKPKGVNT